MEDIFVMIKEYAKSLVQNNDDGLSFYSENPIKFSINQTKPNSGIFFDTWVEVTYETITDVIVFKPKYTDTLELNFIAEELEDLFGDNFKVVVGNMFHSLGSHLDVYKNGNISPIICVAYNEETKTFRMFNYYN